MEKKKDTPFFYVGIVALIIMALMCGYHVANYKTQYNAYITQGYDAATVKSGFPISSIIPNEAEAVGTFGFFAAVMFGINSILLTLGYKPTVKENNKDELTWVENNQPIDSGNAKEEPKEL